jgi:hypothetical protein
MKRRGQLCSGAEVGAYLALMRISSPRMPHQGASKSGSKAPHLNGPMGVVAFVAVARAPLNFHRSMSVQIERLVPPVPC